MRHVGSCLPNQGSNLQSLHWPSREVLGWDYWWFMNRIWQKQRDVISKARLQKHWPLFWFPFLSFSLSLFLSLSLSLSVSLAEASSHAVRSPIERSTWQRTDSSSQQTARTWAFASTAMSVMLEAGFCSLSWHSIAASRETLSWKHPPKLHIDSWLTETMI